MKVNLDQADSTLLAHFVTAASSLRTGSSKSFAPSPGYVSMILKFLKSQKSTLWLKEDVDGIPLATASLSWVSESKSCALGLFEWKENQNAAESILSEAIAEARDYGASVLYAPLDGNTLFNYRLPLDDQAEWKPWEPVHPPGLRNLLLEAGFEDMETYETKSFDLSACSALEKIAILKDIGASVEQTLKHGYEFSPVSVENLKEELGSIADLNSRCFSESFLYAPLPREIVYGYYLEVLRRADFSYSRLCHLHGNLVGYVFAFREGSSLVIKTVSVDPDHRGEKISSALVYYAIRKALEEGLTEIVSALVRSGNTSERLARRKTPSSIRISNRRFALMGLKL